ncbi:alpha/beta fold hydrolase [Mesorhizobium sp. M4A.F.Ca.ET.020.02.1.1]|uniref:alpha/beta fold hydrolase n=2 Tax=Mesorhizobium TaxID=68287 RepID=UPI000FD2401D|nr:MULTISPECIES: alpha/beta fold hydrolase [unclassified Mesorhizobium]RVD43673.1 alpha/beta fold hydrolase [Mesorhizobium sp. M4A.F.Ca.ET.020.02.1.1]RWC11616.1 MAG: alpha/beta fold hydrolase [Mesorhizobium sp.]RWD22559.1 MAG: alpha/beta fold hydrolase [Mesorhizobium sp.]RWD31213.1 MAG: alpha/beta fold hydrolase [Mesorhizobium sp.]TIW28102.1 MAG: alpha/beta fold hydrolase [Mesorhizobium sp.]
MTGPHLYLLGGFDFAGVGAAAPAFSRKARAMVAYLALQAGQAQSREKLAALLWSLHGETQARMSLRQAVSAVRKAMQRSGGGRFLTEGANIALHLDDFDFDVARFEALATSGSIEDLEQALVVYRGDLLDGHGLKEEPFEDWLRVERERLRMMAVAALDRLVTQYGTANDFASCARAAARLLAMEPLREDIHRALMRSFAAQGRINLALKQYELCRDALERDLALAPEPETRQLYETLRARRTKSASHHSLQIPATGTEGSVPIAAPTHYVKSAGINIAYQMTGDGPVDLLYVQGWVSNLDLAWGSPRYAHVLRRLGTFSRLIRIDKRGTGLSDRNVGPPTLEERMEDVRAVLDAVGSKRTVLFGSSEGGPMCMLFAATYPERTAALVLNGTYARGTWSKDYPWARTAEQVDEDLASVERQWGKPAELLNAAPSLSEDSSEREWFAAYLRNSASPADAIALWRWGTEIDVRDILPAIHVPTLVIQRTGDRWVRPEEGRYLARHIEGARYLELAGRDHLIWGEDCDRLVDEIRRIVTGALPAAPSERLLLSVLAIEIAPAGEKAIGQHAEAIRDQLLLFDGREIRRSGDKVLAVFQRPTRAIQCAVAIRERLKPLAANFRSSIHIGECESHGEEFSGVAIEVTSRSLDHARPGEIIASRTVRDLIVGSGLAFEEQGAMCGPPGALQFFCVAATPVNAGA